jgi:hypothetical protein
MQAEHEAGRAVHGPAAGASARAFSMAVLAAAVIAAWLPGGAHAFAIEKWEAGTCTNSECNDGTPSEFYTQAAGHPDFGITDFRFKARKAGSVLHEWQEPEGHVKDVRVDLPAGLAVNPEATKALCTPEELESDKKECPASSQIGVDEATGTAEVALGVKQTVEEEFPVYNMVRNPGEPSRFGVEVNSPKLELLALLGIKLQGHIYLEGGISWEPEPEASEASGAEYGGVTSGDYHEYFRIRDIATQPEVIESRLVFWGIPQEHQKAPTEPPTAFITLPSTCAGVQETRLHVDSWEEPGHYLAKENSTPVTETGCSELAFSPAVALTAETGQSDQPDGLTAALHVPQLTSEPSKPNSPDVQSAQVTLPEGLTLNPSAANGLQACSDAQYAQGSCPSASRVGSASVNAPGVPDGSLTGGVYVGAPEAGQDPGSGGMYRLFVLVESAKAPGAEGPGGEYGIGVRVEGRVAANPLSGRLTASFSGLPEVPFEDFVLHFNGGPRAPLANPLGCGPAAPAGSIQPYGGAATAPSAQGFTVSGCASPLPFSLAQSITAQSTQAGAFSPFTFALSRGDGQQYPSRITTTLPPGLVGAIPSVPLCDEAQANAGTCGVASQVGTVTVAAGAGSEPYTFTGQAYLSGPYEGAPYGLSVVVPALAGPYDLGEVVVRAGIAIGLYSGRVIVASSLPTVVGGVPLRLKSLGVDVDRAHFASNPTNCAPLSFETLLGSTMGASDTLSSPFQATGCGALAFKPKLTVSTGAKTSKPNGASLEVELTEPAHEANIRELQMQLPEQLVARFSTIQKACTAAAFEAGPPPGACESTARVGAATVTTPVLPGSLTGTAWLVSHGSEAFPDLDLVLKGEDVEVVLVGHTHIAHSSITTSTFEELPDVPISKVTLSLPEGPNSALAAGTGRVCATNPVAPTTIIAQNGAKIVQDTKVAVSGCSVVLLSHRLRGHLLILRMWAPEAGRVSVSAHGARAVRFRARKAGVFKISVPIASTAMAALRAGHGRLMLRIAFTPRSGSNRSALKLSLR